MTLLAPGSFGNGSGRYYNSVGVERAAAGEVRRRRRRRHSHRRLRHQVAIFI
jgi:hypothetical protein